MERNTTDLNFFEFRFAFCFQANGNGRTCEWCGIPYTYDQFTLVTSECSFGFYLCVLFDH